MAQGDIRYTENKSGVTKFWVSYFFRVSMDSNFLERTSLIGKSYF